LAFLSLWVGLAMIGAPPGFPFPGVFRGGWALDLVIHCVKNLANHSVYYTVGWS